ncbi:MAG: 50S ribosomal protein L6 [Anaerolineae bacterium]|nr:50S ribosomal protein L6 [Anaerolineae bacterium]
MSRVGKKPIPLPSGVNIAITGTEISVKGKKGELRMRVHPDMSIRQEGEVLLVERPTDQRHHRALHGMTRAIVNNMVVGVSEGYTRTLLIEGVGYRAEVRGKDLVLNLGYSHEIVVPPATENMAFEVPKESRGQVIHVTDIDKQAVGEMAAYIRKQRPPEPYLGKGVRYKNEIIRRKEGKSGRVNKRCRELAVNNSASAVIVACAPSWRAPRPAHA